jgi:hypothetical protein
MRSLHQFWMGLIGMIALTLPAHVWARQPDVLPAFAVTSLNGSSITSDKLSLPNYWLLVYVEPRSKYADTVLSELKTEIDVLNQRVIVIVGGVPASQVLSLSRKYPHLQNVTWYADPKLDAFYKLKVPGSPVVLGMHQQVAQWHFAGSLPKVEVLRSMLRSWREKEK